MTAKRLVRAGIIGWPVSHSLSPRLHGYWLGELGISGEYTAIASPPERLAATIEHLRKDGFAGANLTLPHKVSVIPYLDSIDEQARAIGAVNTLAIDDSGRVHGSNTDAYGFSENLKQQAPGLKKNKAVVLGAGGAAKAVCKALGDLDFKEIVVCNRTLVHAKTLAESFSNITLADWEKRADILEGADLLVNTTSLGLKGQPALDINLARLPKEAMVNDLVYVPLMTPLLSEAKARGHVIIDGLGMLIHQGVPGFTAWFGQRPIVGDAVREYMMGGVTV